MLRLLVLSLLFIIAIPLLAQQPSADTSAERAAAMAKLVPLHGEWRGTAKGNIRGQVFDVTQTERVGPMQGGDVVVIEGRGYAASGKLEFNAFALVSYDTTKDVYEFRNYAHGQANTYPFFVTDTGYSWEMPAGPNAKIRYDITITNGKWVEIGYYIRENKEPAKFMELNLERLGDSSWPAAGFVTK